MKPPRSLLPRLLSLLVTMLIALTTAIAHPTTPRTHTARSAPFAALTGLTTLPHDHSRQEASQRPTKYFHEATFDAHYDGRFASKGLAAETRRYHLRLLLRSYGETMGRIGVETWVMHGCLLGWFWGGRIMPWDNDVDVMVGEGGMRELGGWWNMTVHSFTGEELGLLEKEEEGVEEEEEKEEGVGGMGREALLAVEAEKLNNKVLRETVLKHGKKYLLEVNPHYTNATTKDRHNVIDARWIDTSTGLYIDITAVHTVPQTHDSSSVSETPTTSDYNDKDNDDDIQLYTKNQHAYTYAQLFPLRSTTFEGIAVKIPYDYTSLLVEEYGSRALTHTRYRPPDAAAGHYDFDVARKQWVAQPRVWRGGEGEGNGGNSEGSGRARKGSSWWGRGRGPRRKAKSVEDILEGREGEWVDEDEDADEDG